MTTSKVNPDASAATRDQEARLARQILDAEADAVTRIPVTQAFHDAVDLVVAHTGGRQHGSVVVCGLGKSGIIGQKISATLASTGTPSHFLHPVEAMHGDLGRVRRHDVVLLLSYGGQTDEIVALAALLKQDRAPMIAIIGSAACDLGRIADVALEIGKVVEASPLNAAPTVSTTAMLALGDALALCIAHRRSFGAADFHRMHPAGNLGRQLLPVTQAIRFRVGENLPLVSCGSTVREAVAATMTDIPTLRRPGARLIVDDAGRLAGIFTDGDLVHLLMDNPAALDQPIDAVMIRNPKHLRDDRLVRDAVQMVRQHRIDDLPIVDADGRPVGLLDVQDLVAMKVIDG